MIPRGKKLKILLYRGIFIVQHSSLHVHFSNSLSIFKMHICFHRWRGIRETAFLMEFIDIGDQVRC